MAQTEDLSGRAGILDNPAAALKQLKDLGKLDPGQLLKPGADGAEKPRRCRTRNDRRRGQTGRRRSHQRLVEGFWVKKERGYGDGGRGRVVCML